MIPPKRLAQIPYIGMFLNILYYSGEARKKIEEAFFRKKEVEGGHILRLAYVFIRAKRVKKLKRHFFVKKR